MPMPSGSCSTSKYHKEAAQITKILMERYALIAAEEQSTCMVKKKV